MSAYRFRPLTRADLPLVAAWLGTPHVTQWWGDPREQLALITEDLNEPSMRQWLVEYTGRPFAYVQSYPARAWYQPHLHDLPDHTEVVDTFIGDPGMLGCGHGKAFLRAFAEMLIATGAGAVAIDPDATNFRARRTFTGAGFGTERIAETNNGPVAIMLFAAKNESAGGQAVRTG